jgi:hypothetical protein
MFVFLLFQSDGIDWNGPFSWMIIWSMMLHERTWNKGGTQG